MDKVSEVFLAPAGSWIASPRTRVVEREGWYQLITPGSAYNNEVLLSRIEPARVDDVVRATVAEYGGDPFRWCVGPLSGPAWLGEALARHGLTSTPVCGMAIDPRTWQAAPRAPGVTIEWVTEASVADYADVFARGWERDAEPDHGDNLRRALTTGRFWFVIARVDGVAAGTAGFVVNPRSAYLRGGNVLRAYRGRGVYRALVDARLRRLAELGVELATTRAHGETSGPILERWGFETVFRAAFYRRQDRP